MTREELETLKEIRQDGISPHEKFPEIIRKCSAIRAAIALIARLPTFADGAPMVTPCDVWIVPAKWSWMSDVEGGREPEQVKIWNYNADRHGGHYCLSFDNSSDMNFGFGQVYQTKQAAREAMS
jgi:hypothetical protein